MKKIFIFLLSTLISSTFYACNIPVNQNNSNVKQKQEQNEPKIDIEKLKKDFPIKAFSTKALNGNNNISFNTEGLNYKFNTSAFLHAYGFEKDRVYNIYLKSNSNETIYMFMWKKINGVWIPARWVKNSDNISFRGGAIDFSEILLWPACSINPASGNISIKQEDNNIDITKEELGKRLLKDNYKIVTQDYLAYYNGGSSCITGYHPGIDYRAAVGTPVYSPVSGTVTQEIDSMGQVAIKINNSTKRFIFMHLGSSNLKLGTWVNAGDLIGYSGTRGTSAPHLHVEIRDGRNTGACYFSTSTNTGVNDNPINFGK